MNLILKNLKFFRYKIILQNRNKIQFLRKKIKKLVIMINKINLEFKKN
jgi:hypothetical protein